jgi:hypothetical protein
MPATIPPRPWPAASTTGRWPQCPCRTTAPPVHVGRNRGRRRHRQRRPLLGGHHQVGDRHAQRRGLGQQHPHPQPPIRHHSSPTRTSASPSSTRGGPRTPTGPHPPGSRPPSPRPGHTPGAATPATTTGPAGQPPSPPPYPGTHQHGPTPESPPRPSPRPPARGGPPVATPPGRWAPRPPPPTTTAAPTAAAGSPLGATTTPRTARDSATEGPHPQSNRPRRARRPTTSTS